MTLINPIFDNIDDSDNNSDYESYDLYSVYDNNNYNQIKTDINPKPKSKLSHFIHKYFLCCLIKKN